MALEAGVSHQDLFEYNGREIYNMFEFGYGMEENLENNENENWFDLLENQTNHYWNSTSTLSSPPPPSLPPLLIEDPKPAADTAGDVPPVKPRRRRQRNRKNKEEIEKQRMTHITVERNRRKQMNNYLSALRQLMPDSYVHRSDQASIIGGAINYVKELEHRLQFLNGKKKMNYEPVDHHITGSSSSAGNSAGSISEPAMDTEPIGELDDVEVTVVENHANLRIRSKKRPRQLLKMVSGLQRLRFSILHLNVTTIDQTVLYSLNVKVEDDCQVGKGSVDEIVSAVSQILSSKIHEDEEASII
ncbi:transcription factor bHLH96-like [Impatiens glandulifera]|uniref:transcription factor bHLH96-like n=1 Tax=Impatiens glandulifera TaxID=253017 RepID=UPI001FB0519F|nr:transcription factor bHLH96-like [Impatiens glandulifera]XP_047339384.1 transcription factor bHLH96-like [Impatiens glandulifera]